MNQAILNEQIRIDGKVVWTVNLYIGKSSVWQQIQNLTVQDHLLCGCIDRFLSLWNGFWFVSIYTVRHTYILEVVNIKCSVVMLIYIGEILWMYHIACPIKTPWSVKEFDKITVCNIKIRYHNCPVTMFFFCFGYRTCIKSTIFIAQSNCFGENNLLGMKRSTNDRERIKTS